MEPGRTRRPPKQPEGPPGRWLRKREASWACIRRRDSAPALGLCVRSLSLPWALPSKGPSGDSGSASPWPASPPRPCPFQQLQPGLATDRWEREGGRRALPLRPDATCFRPQPGPCRCPSGARLLGPNPHRSLTSRVIWDTLGLSISPVQRVLTECLHPGAAGK